eukprot:CAMPEP_0172481572 /NCGR_PEP_ID=MMETSP1066-20121228/7555_1 /TAXON_ID=671091 /ORGANISM="Coscinodiscus wailesii, Strain CCMP2513" /LENGTH=468 /DNA_ID=CAMNT_0013243997 /DNA_START=101 /DNA_END=1507 /DNA_ORIENTATION=-
MIIPSKHLFLLLTLPIVRSFHTPTPVRKSLSPTPLKLCHHRNLNTPQSPRRHTRLFSFASSTTKTLQKRNVKMPLFLPEESHEAITPLPAAHLPPEIATLNLYGMIMSSASHIRMVEDAKMFGARAAGESRDILGRFGYVVRRRDDSDSLVGATGVVVDILVCSPAPPESVGSDDADPQRFPKVALLTRGSFRFTVKEITSSIPYPTAIVDELLDYDESHEEQMIYYNDFTDNFQNDEPTTDDDDDEEEPCHYSGLNAGSLSRKCLEAMQTLISQKLSKPSPTLLERSILDTVGVSPSAEADKAEEMAAVFALFQEELVEMTDVVVRRYAIAMLAAEMAGVSDETRQEIVVTRDGVERLRTVLRGMDEVISRERAKALTEQIVEETTDDDEKQLKVGKPSLPPWTKAIQTGMRCEYYWNEEEGWCAGTVVEVERIVDELLIVFKFDVDGETHRLPFLADEKARWRPLR